MLNIGYFKEAGILFVPSLKGGGMECDMKKIKWMLAVLPVIMATALMFPAESVHALKRLTVLEEETLPLPEVGIKPIQPEESETEEIKTEEIKTKEDTYLFSEETAEITALESGQEETGQKETEEKSTEEPLPECVSDILDDMSEEKNSLTVKIDDNIAESIAVMEDKYVKKAYHTITVSVNAAEDFDAYKAFSYVIYRENDESMDMDICKEGLLEMPYSDMETMQSVVETEYTQAGNYCIIVTAAFKADDKKDEELIRHEFYVKKEKQRLDLKKSTVSLEYGQSVYIDDLIKQAGAYGLKAELTAVESDNGKGKILEIAEDTQGQMFIRASGMNGAEEGRTAVLLKLSETPLLEESVERKLIIKVKPLRLSMKMQLNPSDVYMYDTLNADIVLIKDEKDVTKDIFESDKDLYINFNIMSENETYQLNSNSSNFSIPVKKEYFREFSKGTLYTIKTELIYKDDENGYFPYKVNSEKKSFELLGRKAKLTLSPDDNGSYDYRACYGEVNPALNIEIYDTTASSEENTDALDCEADLLVYKISSTNEKVVTADSERTYTARDKKIPLIIKGVGTATITADAAGGSTYTVEKASVTINVKDSPLYDEDFVISIVDKEGVTKQSFVSDATGTGFEKWQQKINEKNGWFNESITVSLTKKGSKYYKELCIVGEDENAETAEQVSITGDRKIMQYSFWAVNADTNADTHNSGENGTRSFKLGIDMTKPVIKEFIPSSDYYKASSTETQQYFSDKFELSGTFTDNASGIAKIEYCTDFTAQGDREWKQLAHKEGEFKLVLENGSYPAIAVRAVDAAGNVSDGVCLTNKNGDYIHVIVDNTKPVIKVTMFSDGKEYSAENECWTNQAVNFCISENKDISKEDVEAGLYRVEYAYKSIGDVLKGEEILPAEWQELSLNENGEAVFSVGEALEAVNKNGCYYFRGVSKTGVKSVENTKKRILLWQSIPEKKSVILSGVKPEKCHNGWYNIQSGAPVIDFAYPEYDTGNVSGEYASPITIHCRLKVFDENDNLKILYTDNSATIRTFVNENNLMTVSDDVSKMQVKLENDGIYTLEYWAADAAGNSSNTECITYKMDMHAPTNLRLMLNDEELSLTNDSALVYERFYQNSVTGSASAEYGISKKESITILKAKRIGEWEKSNSGCDAGKFSIEPGTRCLLYVRAVDGAGNMSEGWTRGIVADNKPPAEERFIVESDGENEHGFFNKDVKVHIGIKDEPADKSCASLKMITCSVGADGIDTISEKELFSSKEEIVPAALLEETESFSTVETVSAKENEGNRAYITVRATDRSGNESIFKKELKIDVTKPEIDISFDNENAVNGRYYNTDRRAKISIKELNFDKSRVEITVKRNGEPYIPFISDWQTKDDEHFAFIDFKADGDYSLEAVCTDLADNKSDKAQAEPFTIDKTKPCVEIRTENSEAANAHPGCFNKAQTVVITVTEHNFDEKTFNIVSNQAGNTGASGAWKHENDTHTIRLVYDYDGKYEISCDYTDLAGNPAEKTTFDFIVDRTNPHIEISGVENNSANAGVVVPVITISDDNIEQKGCNISFMTGTRVVPDISADIEAAEHEGGFLFTVNGLDKWQDDIYYMTVTAFDKAGNSEEKIYRFSLNRRGSSYDLTGLEKLMGQYYGTCRTLEDLTIVEMNVDKVDDFELYMTYNTEIIYGEKGKRPVQGEMNSIPEKMLYDVKMSGNEDTGYTYTYTIYRENFRMEGSYRLGIYSRDRAGNEVNNLLKLNGEEIQFVVDNTIPRVIIEGVENNKIYDTDKHEIRVVADDNFKLEEAQLLLVNNKNEVLEQWDYLDLVGSEGDTAVITIGEHKEEVTLIYRATDAAGNKIEIQQGTKAAKEEFLVTTDKLVQFVNKPAQTTAGRFIIIMSVLLILAITFIVFLKKKEKER